MKKLIYLSLVCITALCLMLFVGCNETESITHNHTFGEWTVTNEASCLEDGSRTRACQCGESETEIIPAAGHTEEIVAGTPATCAEAGLTEGKKCSVCGETTLNQEEISPLNHSYKYTEIIDENGDIATMVVCQREACGHTSTSTAGLYDADNNLVASWDELLTVYGLDIEKDYGPKDSINEKSHLKYIYQNCEDLIEATRLIISDSIDKIGDYSFYSCDFLAIVEIPNSIKNIGVGVFFNSDVDIYYNGTSDEWQKIDYAETFISSSTCIYYNGKIEFITIGYVGDWGSSGVAGVIKKIVVDGESIYINGVLYEVNRMDNNFEISYPSWFKLGPIYSYEEERLENLDKIQLCENWYVLERVEENNSNSKIAVCYLDNAHYFITFIEENGNLVAQSVFRALIG